MNALKILTITMVLFAIGAMKPIFGVHAKPKDPNRVDWAAYLKEEDKKKRNEYCGDKWKQFRMPCDSMRDDRYPLDGGLPHDSGRAVNGKNYNPLRVRRERSGGSLVCCEIDRGLKIKYLGRGLADLHGHMIPEQDCRKNRRRIVDTGLCKSECRKAGKGWEWKSGRCQRAAVRDKRGRPTEFECRKRGENWVWRNNRCQRTAVRDKRPGKPSMAERRARCNRRGKSWVWNEQRGRCQRSAVRDKRRDANLVCCRIDVTSGIGKKILSMTVGYSDYRFGMIPDKECGKKSGKKTRVVVSKYMCIKACERAGKDWAWSDKRNRCLRSAVRDKR